MRPPAGPEALNVDPLPVDGFCVPGADADHPSGPPAPTVGDLATAHEAIPPTMSCRDVERRFRQADAPRSIVVELPQGPSLLNREAFYQALVGPRGFGWALYHRKPVAVLPIASSPLVFTADTPALEASRTALHTEGVAAGDDALVLWPDGRSGSVAVAQLFAVLADHDRSQAQALAASHARFKAMVEHLSDVICVISPDGVVTYVSPSYTAVTGIEVAACVGADASSMVHADDRTRIAVLLDRCRKAPGVTLNDELHISVAGGPTRTFEVVARNLIDDPSVVGVVMTWRDVTNQRKLEERLRHDAFHDSLTGLANRALLRERSAHALMRLSRSSSGVAIVFLDLDGFKNVNDLWGHDTGDAVLHQVAAALADAVRAEDTLARLGGDEFAVLLEDVTAEEAAAAAVRLDEALRHPVRVKEGDAAVRASIGVAVTNDPTVGPEELLRRADLAMYAAKARRAHETVVWSVGLEGGMIDDQQLASDLRRALRDGELHLVYQPIVSMLSGRTDAVEALCRWTHPERGPVGPDRFIPIAERSGLIDHIGRWVLSTATAQAATWRRAGNPIRVAVNVSGRQLIGRDFASDVRMALSESGLPASLLEIEVTETALVADIAEAAKTLHTLKQLGVRIAIDDFGTGYSSLAYLDELPVDTVKIDKSFIARIGATAEGANLIDGVVRLAHRLGLTVVAEGVEGLEQDQILRDLACDAAQGYLYARPAAPDDATGLPPQPAAPPRRQAAPATV